MVSEKDPEFRQWLRMINLKNNPILIVQDENYRDFAGFKYKICITHVKNIIVKMTELVEDKIITELNTITCGAIMHDRWSRCGVHYLCCFSCYIFDNQPKYRLILFASMSKRKITKQLILQWTMQQI